MKIKSYLLAPLCGAMALMVLGSCSDEQIVEGNDNGRPEGNGIVFGASANYIKKPGTKTAYGEYDNSSNPTSQEILWLADDRVEVWSPTSPSVKQVEYQITGIDEQDGGSAYLASYQGRNGLQWDMASETQDFYAVYPSPASIENQEMVQEHNIRLENGVLHGFIPTNQEYQFTRDASADGGWRCTPTMDWQYMVARTDDFLVPHDGTDGDVSLNFKPLVTTLEITLEGPSSPLAQLNVFAPEGDIIMGEFSCDLKQGDSWGEGFLPTCVAEQTGTVTNYITVNLYDTDGSPITLAEGEHLTINVFMLPTEPWTDLEIRLAGYNTAARTLQLDYQGTPIALSEHLKTRVRVAAPQIGDDETNQWIGALNDNVLITQLSIPGTANAFSYNFTGDTNADKWKTQTATIEEQWNAGIRCFELVCDENRGNVAGATLKCNRHEINSNLTFASAVEQIWNLVQGTVDEEGNPTEFAVIIPSYDSNTGHPNGNYNGVDSFANGLNAFYDAHGEYKYQTFTRELTVGEARGSLIFIARITSEEDGDHQVPAPHKGTFVDQWGSLADNWARRGYATANGTRVHNWNTDASDTQSVEYYSHTEESRSYGTDNTGNITASIPTNALTASLPVDFEHLSRRAGGGSGTAYIQDWRRVVPREGIVDGLRPGMFYLGYVDNGWFRDDSYHYYYWPESLTEKEKHIWDTFEKAIAENAEVGGGDMFYINSLDGYFVDPEIPLSYAPYVLGNSWGFSYNDVGLSAGGTEGNILAYANYINDYFYNRILSYGVTNIYGPMNIILMDYVYDGTDGGDRLPSTIINNNFRFPLQVRTEANSFGTGGTSMGDGGSAIE